MAREVTFSLNSLTAAPGASIRRTAFMRRLVASFNPSAKALAAGAPIKVDVSKLGPGEILGPIPAWRDKPIFIVKRSDEMLGKLNSQNIRLADPASDREQQPEYAKNDTRSIKP